MSESTSRLRDFVAELMAMEGAEVEKIEPDGLEFMAPAPLQHELQIAEFGRLGFSAEMPAGSERVSFESDWLERLGHLIGHRGRASLRVLHLPVEVARPVLSAPERMLEHAFVLQNAVYRFTGVAPAWTRYWVINFHYTALSDEKRDGLLPLVLNLANGSTPDEFAELLIDGASHPDYSPNSSLPIGAKLPPRWEAARLSAVAHRALPARVRRSLAPFFNSMNRRLQRDLERLHSYYDDLRDEALVRVRKHKDELERERQRVEAIAREYQAKVNDLQQKYALSVAVEHVQTLELIMPVQRLEFVIRRRKGERRMHLDWNPLTRRLESPPCEFSYTGGATRVVCDERLHLVSPEAHGDCVACGKAYCRACHPARCPRCARV